ncbi:MAG: hypothetical protein WC596_00050 [Candidatus Shapirobacteria bacterium]
MPLDLTPDQLNQLHSLGLNTPSPVLSKKRRGFLPLLSISGLTLFSFGGLILLKSNNSSATIQSPLPARNTEPVKVLPTQVPKSIQHYLLASQTYFSQAISAQNQKKDQPIIVDLLNQSLIFATSAIREFPTDYRGYLQRGKIYQNLADSKADLLPAAIADLALAQKFNSTSPEITKILAALYAKKGDAQNTLTYLAETINLEPTSAQNFYDLARIQKQTGLLPQAISTYDRLLPLLTDEAQISQVQSEKIALEALVSQNKSSLPIQSPQDVGGTPSISLPADSPTIQAFDSSSGLIIAAPEDAKNISVSNLTDSNALFGQATLPQNQASISLTNQNITPDSQIYVAVLSGGNNLSLKVLSRSAQAFVVGLDSPIANDVVFKWWIVNP